MVLLLVFMQLTRDLFAIAKFLFSSRFCFSYSIAVFETHLSRPKSVKGRSSEITSQVD